MTLNYYSRADDARLVIADVEWRKLDAEVDLATWQDLAHGRFDSERHVVERTVASAADR